MLIVGLGNPGSAYEKTRHNVGFMVVDALLKRHQCDAVKKAVFEGDLYKFSTHFFLKPLTFMNLSGRSIANVKRFYKIDEVIVIHDDLDLPFGTLRFKRGGGHGGHNGLKSTDTAISPDYIRVRMGIGHPGDRNRVADYVLSAFTPAEREHLPAWIDRTADAVEALMRMSMDEVASKYTVKKTPLQ
ncbi:aminoacyl-tRNA hydrolase [Sulfurimonas sp. HSL1-2]|uniref:aminoacyl-tRNA hydrolase n=1 Tax=Thiomicrolovo zhangzhouensis TaxID=3131933 RepID=UPI0031F738E7